MPTKVVDTILPTTMIGSYPKPRWYTRYNLEGADLLEWWKLEENWHAWWDATTACISDQELAGLDIVTDGRLRWRDRLVRVVLVRAARWFHQGEAPQPAGARDRGR